MTASWAGENATKLFASLLEQKAVMHEDNMNGENQQEFSNHQLLSGFDDFMNNIGMPVIITLAAYTIIDGYVRHIDAMHQRISTDHHADYHVE